jgi:cytochrome c oxidase subunit 1
MAMTDTRPPAAAPEAVPVPRVADAAPAEAPGLAGWFTTSDHKRIGRLWVATSLLFLVVGGVAGAVLGFERMGDGLDLLTSGSFAQVYTFHGEVAVWLFLVPCTIGIATVVLPLQVGSPEIAFPRGAAAAYWAYLVSAVLLVGAYAADGGPTGGSSAAVDLYLLALLGLLLSTGLALVCLLTTAITMRTAGMGLDRTPAFTWSIVVGGSLTLLTSPVLGARLVEAYIGSHFGGDIGAYSHISWFWSLPQVYLLAVPAAGVALEVVPVLAGTRLRRHGAALVVIGALGVLGLGGWAQYPPAFDDLLYVGLALAAVIAPLALLGLLGDTLRAGGAPKGGSKAALALSLGAVVFLLLGAIAGALQSIDGLDLRGTVWEAGQVHLVLYGAATMGTFAALWWWAPKLWGATLSEGLGLLAFAASFLGGLALVVPDLVNGLANDVPLRGRTFGDDTVTTLNVVSAVGGVLVVLAVVAVVLALLAIVRSRGACADDPWNGATLEWATSSPPASANFSSAIPLVTSATPLLDTNSEVSA